jgi:hypothetical protein
MIFGRKWVDLKISRLKEATLSRNENVHCRLELEKRNESNKRHASLMALWVSLIFFRMR